MRIFSLIAFILVLHGVSHAQSVRDVPIGELLGIHDGRDMLQVDAELGRRYITGVDGERRDLERGIQLLQQAAKRNHSPSLYFLATIYYTGLGVELNYSKARSLLEAAREHGSSTARRLFEVMNNNEIGGEQDMEKLRGAYYEASELGPGVATYSELPIQYLADTFSHSEYFLGIMFMLAQAGASNEVEVRGRIEITARSNDPNALAALKILQAMDK